MKQKNASVRCGKCKKVFPIGDAHNARTCGKTPHPRVNSKQFHTAMNLSTFDGSVSAGEHSSIGDAFKELSEK